MESVDALLLFKTSVGVHVLALHVCKPRPAVADIVYPVPHAKQSIVHIQVINGAFIQRMITRIV